MTTVTTSGTGASAEPVLLFKTIQSNAMRTLFLVLKEILHDVNLCVDSTGVKLMMMDNPKCAVVSLKLRANAFEEFKCTGAFTLGLNMHSMSMLLHNHATNNDTVTFYLETPQSSKLGIRIENAERNTVTEFKLQMLDVDENIISMADVDFDSVITMPSGDFLKVCREMSNLSDTMNIRSEGNRLVLSCEGPVASQQTIINESDAYMSVDTRPVKVVEGDFPLKYLTTFSKASSLSSTIQLFLKEAYLLVLQYNVASLGELRFAVAGKIGDDQ